MPITKNISIRNGHLYDLDQSNSCRVTVAYWAHDHGVRGSQIAYLRDYYEGIDWLV